MTSWKWCLLLSFVTAIHGCAPEAPSEPESEPEPVKRVATGKEPRPWT